MACDEDRMRCSSLINSNIFDYSFDYAIALNTAVLDEGYDRVAFSNRRLSLPYKDE